MSYSATFQCQVKEGNKYLNNSCFYEYPSYHDSSIEYVFYKVSVKMALTQVCTRFLPQLCSALLSNSHPSDSDLA